MKKENRFGLLSAVLLSVMVIAWMLATGGYKAKPVARDTHVVHIVHNNEYYAQTLIADRAAIPGLPSAEEIIAAEGEKLAHLFLKAAGAYNDFAVQTKDKSTVSSLYEKYAYYTYRAGVVYQESLHDNETACWYYGGALSADQNNPLYRKNYGFPICQSYRNKQ